MDSEVNTAELVEVYLTIREERSRILREYEEQDKALKADMSQLEAMLLDTCNKVNASSINTQHGTIIRSLKERFVCSDWDSFKQFVRENDAVDCLERRIHQGNFKEFLKDRVDDGLPPGVNVMREFGITVRKSSKE
jgi:hypothetical protein